MIVLAAVKVELAVIAHRPGFWVTAVITVTAVLAACILLSRTDLLLPQRPPRADDRNIPAVRSRRMRITAWGMMVAVTFLIFVLRPVHDWYYGPYYEGQAAYHGMMAVFCEYEAGMMTRKAEACRARSRRDTPWDEPGERSEDLRCWPYPGDVPKYGSWSEQAEVWDRAARRSLWAADRHSRISDDYDVWKLSSLQYMLRSSVRE